MELFLSSRQIFAPTDWLTLINIINEGFIVDKTKKDCIPFLVYWKVSAILKNIKKRLYYCHSFRGKPAISPFDRDFTTYLRSSYTIATVTSSVQNRPALGRITEIRVRSIKLKRFLTALITPYLTDLLADPLCNR